MQELLKLSLENPVTGKSFVFAGSELPDHVGLGGSQNVAVHELIGGGRVVDSLGEQPKDIEWSGWFLGASAIDRLQALEAMRDAGQELTLTWSKLGFKVLITAVTAHFQRFYQIPYTITLTVTEDLSAKPRQASTSLDSQMAADLATSQQLVSAACAQTGAALPAATAAVTQQSSSMQSTLSQYMTSTNGISKFASSSSGDIASMLSPILALRQASSQLLSQVDNLTQSITTLGGLAPNNPLARNAARLTNTLNLYNAQPALVQLDGVLGRMMGNLQQVPAASKTVAVSGGDLFKVAQQQYGDASGWTVLAQANGTADPQIVGTAVLKVPPAPATASGGVLNA